MSRFAVSLYYKLNADHSATPVETWQEAQDTLGRVLARTEIGDDAFVSTIFLGLNMAPLPGHKPILFETMGFIAGDPVSTNRYPTYDLAMAGHRLVVGGVEEEVANRAVLSALDTILPADLGAVVKIPGMRKRGPRKML